MTRVSATTSPWEAVSALAGREVRRTSYVEAANTTVFQKIDAKTGDVVLQVPDEVRVENLVRERETRVDFRI